MQTQPQIIEVNERIRLKKYYDNFTKTLTWYQDRKLCKQVDNIDFVYDLDRLKKMYRYLNKNGECYYIQYKVKNRFLLVGDAAILYDKDVAIVIDPKYQNLHIGRLVLQKLIERAKALDFDCLCATIYSFNKQSITAFKAAGFRKIAAEKYRFDIKTAEN